MGHGGSHSRRRSLLLLGTVIATVLALHVAPAAAADPVRVMPLGDSITDGYNTPGGYRVELERVLRSGGHEPDFVGSLRNGPAGLVDRDHEGHSGYPVADIAASVDGWLASARPDVVLLMIGTNDVIWNRDGRAGAPARLDTLLGKIAAAAPQARVIVSTIPPLHDDRRRLDVQAYNDALVSVVKARADAGGKVALVDAHAAMDAGHISADGVHPTLEGQKVIARTFRAGLATVFPK